MSNSDTPERSARPTRRDVMAGLTGGIASLGLWSAAARAQPPAPPTSNGGRANAAPPDAEAIARALPLDSVGLEHIGTVVPDVTEATRFFGRVFNPVVHKEMNPPQRYYVTFDPGYIALGFREGEETAFIDHDCIMVESFDRAAMAARLEQEGLPQGRFGIFPDVDGLGLQLLPIGGLAGSTEPAGRIVDGAPLVRPRGLYRVVRIVEDLERSVAFYRKFLGPETDRRPDGNPGEEAVWFTAGPTFFGLQQAQSGETPRIDRFCVNVAFGDFDAERVAQELTELGAEVRSAPSDPLLHFRSPEGIGVELRPVDPARIWGRA